MFEEAINNVSAFMHTLSSQNILPSPRFSLLHEKKLVHYVPNSILDESATIFGCDTLTYINIS